MVYKVLYKFSDPISGDQYISAFELTEDMQTEFTNKLGVGFRNCAQYWCHYEAPRMWQKISGCDDDLYSEHDFEVAASAEIISIQTAEFLSIDMLVHGLAVYFEED